MTLFSGVAVVHSPTTLFNATSSRPLALWSVHRDRAAPERSGGLFLRDDAGPSIELTGAEPVELEELKDAEQFQSLSTAKLGAPLLAPGRLLNETVLQLQGPDIRKTFVRAPPRLDEELGLKLAVLHLHFSLLDRSQGSVRPFALEVGVRDTRQSLFRIRLGTYHAEAEIVPRPDPVKSGGDGRPNAPLLLLPLEAPELPAKETPEHQLLARTPWLLLVVRLPDLLKLFGDTSLRDKATAAAEAAAEQDAEEEEDGQPSSLPRHHDPPHLPVPGRFESIAYIQVHANVRLRRIWAAADPMPEPGETASSAGWPEFALHTSTPLS